MQRTLQRHRFFTDPTFHTNCSSNSQALQRLPLHGSPQEQKLVSTPAFAFWRSGRTLSYDDSIAYFVPGVLSSRESTMVLYSPRMAASQ